MQHAWTTPRCAATLEVIGGLVFVNTVVVSQSLTAINFAEPTPDVASALACWRAALQERVAAGC